MIKKLIALLASLFICSLSHAQTPQYNWRYQSSTSCNTITTGKFADLCKQTFDNTLWSCTPTEGQTGTCDTSSEWSELKGAAYWGGITGTLSSQTDLQNKFDAENVLSGTGMYITPNVSDNGDGTISVASAEATLYSLSGWQGTKSKYTVPALNNVSLTDNSVNYLIVDYNSGFPIYSVTTNPADINSSNKILAATLYREGPRVHIIETNWGLDTQTRLVNRLINTKRFERSSGLMLSEKTVTGTPRVISISSGVIWYGPQNIAEEAVDSKDGIANGATFYYHSSGNWISTDVNQYNNIQYDNGTDLVSLGTNKYTVNWIYRFIDGDTHPKIAFILGNNEYTNLATAANAPVPTPPIILTRHSILVGRIIVKKNEDTSTQIDSSFTQVFEGSGITDHNNLAGLQGGNTGEYYHLNNLDYTNRWHGNNSDTYYILGNVGIGTSSPLAGLDVDGTLYSSKLNITVNNVIDDGSYADTSEYDLGSGLVYGTFQDQSITIRAFAYRDIGLQRVYSTNPTTIIISDNSHAPFWAHWILQEDTNRTGVVIEISDGIDTYWFEDTSNDNFTDFITSDISSWAETGIFTNATPTFITAHAFSTTTSGSQFDLPVDFYDLTKFHKDIGDSNGSSSVSPFQRQLYDENGTTALQWENGTWGSRGLYDGDGNIAVSFGGNFSDSNGGRFLQAQNGVQAYTFDSSVSWGHRLNSLVDGSNVIDIDNRALVSSTGGYILTWGNLGSINLSKSLTIQDQDNLGAQMLINSEFQNIPGGVGEIIYGWSTDGDWSYFTDINGNTGVEGSSGDLFQTIPLNIVSGEKYYNKWTIEYIDNLGNVDTLGIHKGNSSMTMGGNSYPVDIGYFLWSATAYNTDSIVFHADPDSGWKMRVMNVIDGSLYPGNNGVYLNIQGFVQANTFDFVPTDTPPVYHSITGSTYMSLDHHVYTYNGSSWMKLDNNWEDSLGTIYPLNSTDRVLVGGATDDGVSALQVNGNGSFSMPLSGQTLKFKDEDLGGFNYYPSIGAENSLVMMMNGLFVVGDYTQNTNSGYSYLSFISYGMAGNKGTQIEADWTQDTAGNFAMQPPGDNTLFINYPRTLLNGATDDGVSALQVYGDSSFYLPLASTSFKFTTEYIDAFGSAVPTLEGTVPLLEGGVFVWDYPSPSGGFLYFMNRDGSIQNWITGSPDGGSSPTSTSLYYQSQSGAHFFTDNSEPIAGTGRVIINTKNDDGTSSLQVNGNNYFKGIALIDPDGIGDQLFGYSYNFQTVGHNPQDATTEYQMAAFVGDNTYNRYQFTLSNSGGGHWSNNFLSFNVHGSSYPNKYYLNGGSDTAPTNAGLAQINAQGSEISKLSIGTFNSSPVSLYTADTERIIITSVGQTLIGQDAAAISPDGTSSLQVSGKSYFSTDPGYAIEATNIGNSYGAAGYFHSVAGSLYLGYLDTNKIIDATGSSHFTNGSMTADIMSSDNFSAISWDVPGWWGGALGGSGGAGYFYDSSGHYVYVSNSSYALDVTGNIYINDVNSYSSIQLGKQDSNYQAGYFNNTANTGEPMPEVTLAQFNTGDSRNYAINANGRSYFKSDSSSPITTATLITDPGTSHGAAVSGSILDVSPNYYFTGMLGYGNDNTGGTYTYTFNAGWFSGYDDGAGGIDTVSLGYLNNSTGDHYAIKSTGKSIFNGTASLTIDPSNSTYFGGGYPTISSSSAYTVLEGGVITHDVIVGGAYQQAYVYFSDVSENFQSNITQDPTYGTLLYYPASGVNNFQGRAIVDPTLGGLTDNGSSALQVSGDITTTPTGAFYFGDINTDGSWRIVRSGNNLNFERRESGSWVAKGAMVP